MGGNNTRLKEYKKETASCEKCGANLRKPENVQLLVCRTSPLSALLICSKCKHPVDILQFPGC